MIAGMPDRDDSTDDTVSLHPAIDDRPDPGVERLAMLAVEARIMPRLPDSRPSSPHRPEPHRRITTVHQLARPPPHYVPLVAGLMVMGADYAGAEAMSKKWTRTLTRKAPGGVPPYWRFSFSAFLCDGAQHSHTRGVSFRSRKLMQTKITTR